MGEAGVTGTMLSNLDAALALRAEGFWPVMTYPKGYITTRRDGTKTTEDGKRPIGKAWGLDRWPVEKLRSESRRVKGAGVGVGLGPRRAPGGGWQIDLEGDGPEAADSLDALLGGELVETRGWGSTRGSHNLFTVDGERLLILLGAAGAKEGSGLKAGVWHLDELPGLEWRVGGYKDDGAVKQVQSIVPPTIGDNGQPREWNGVEQVAVLPQAAFALLEAIAQSRRLAVDAEGMKAKEGNGEPHENNGHVGSSHFVLTVESGLHKWAQAALSRELETFAAQAPSGRHAYLLICTLKLASLVNARALTEAECAAGLKQAAITNGMGAGRFHEVDSAWTSALKMARARDLSHLGNNRAPGNSQAAKAAPSGAQDATNIQLEYASLSNEELGIISAESVQEAPIDWLWIYRLAKGEMALLAGDGGLGKSSLLLAFAALITVGGPWPDGSGLAPVGSVIIVSAEDSRETTLKPRLMALGANLARVKFVTAKLRIKKPGKEPMVSIMTLQDILYWRELLRRVPECKLLIVDPIPSYLGRSVNDSKNGELRNVVEPFLDLVVRPAGVCFVANTHLNKNIDAKTPLHRVSGSTAYGALPRNVHFCFPDPENPDRIFFKQAKCNNAPRDLPAVAYSLVRADVQSGAGEIETSFPVFEAETVKGVDLQEAVGASRKGRSTKPGPPKAHTLAQWLLNYLRQAIHPIQKGVIYDAAGDAGLIGEYGPTGKDKKLRWSDGYLLKRAFARVPMLQGDDAGWLIEETKLDERGYWQAIRFDSGSPETNA
jgi:energy-coupling factor transporter ATP-binding protein EcfA2